MRRTVFVVLALLATSQAVAQDPPQEPEQQQKFEIGIPALSGQWYTQTQLANGSVIENQVVINGLEWSSTSIMHSVGAFGLPVTYRSGQGGTLEVFPPVTIRFAVFWQVPQDINNRGVLLPPGSTFTIEQFTATTLVLADAACMQSASKEQCLVTYRRQQLGQ